MPKKLNIEVGVDTKDARKNVDGLNKSLDNTAKAGGKAAKSNDNLKDSSTALGGGFGAAAGGAKTLLAGFKALILSPIGIILGVVAGIILAVKTAFTSSEAGQNKYTKLMSILGSVVGNLTDKLSDFGEFLISVFEDPMGALEDFADAFKKNIVTRFEGFLGFIPSMGKAIKQMFEGDFAGAAETATDALGKVTLGVESLSANLRQAGKDSKDFFDEMARDAEIASGIADDRAKADKLERGLIVERAEADRKIIELREKAARRDKFSSAERKAALKEALTISENIINKEVEAAKLRASAFIKENKLSKSNKEALKAEEEAKAAVIILETKRLNLQKRLGTELSTINLELAAKSKKEADSALKAEAKAAKEIETAETLAAKKAEIEEKALQTSIDNEIKSIQRSLELKRELKLTLAEEGLNDDNLTPDEILLRAEAVREAELEIRDANLEIIQANFENDSISEDERNALREKQEHDSSLKIIDVNKRQSQAIQDIDTAKTEALKANADKTANVLNSFAAIAGAHTKAGKLMAVSAASIDTFRGVGDALAAKTVTPFETGLKFANATAIGLAGVSNVKKILAVKIPNMSSGGGSAPSIGSLPKGSASAPPLNSDVLRGSSDVEGVSDEGIGANKGINQIRAVVVESDITTAQQNVRGFEESSEIG